MPTTEDYVRLLEQFVKQQKLEKFYPSGSSTLRDLATKAQGYVDKLKSHVYEETAQMLYRLALYDVIILLDDSGSMQWDNGRRIKSLQHFLKIVVEITHIYNPRGVSIRWLNSCDSHDGITAPSQIENCIKKNPFYGWTKLGHALRDRVLAPLVLNPASRHALARPVMVMVITDGEPAGEPRTTFKHVIQQGKKSMEDYGYHENSIEYQICHVGNEQVAINFLRSLDSDPDIGSLIDATSEEGIERAEVLAMSGNPLDHKTWVAKIMMGPLDHYGDEQDENPDGPSSESKTKKGKPVRNHPDNNCHDHSSDPHYHQNWCATRALNGQYNFGPHMTQFFPAICNCRSRWY